MSKNPKRGCGTKKEDSCYGESPDEGEDGVLLPWVWTLGDSYHDIITLEIPPRMMMRCNPAATLAARELVLAFEPNFVLSNVENFLYDRLCLKTKNVGVADHVGKINYSPHSFAREALWLGVSRKIPPQLGKELAELIYNNGPISMLHTHEHMPVFDNDKHLEQALDIAKECLRGTWDFDSKEFDWEPTWEIDGWSQYANTAQDGGNHVLVPILQTIHNAFYEWEKYKDYDHYQKARGFFNEVFLAEQPFGLSWLGKITYTADKDGGYSEMAQFVQDNYGSQVVDLIDLKEKEVTV